MRIDAQEITVLDLLNAPGEIFKIPIYQRNYAWGKDQWGDLWDDLEEIEEDDIHFIGSIVVISDRHKVKGFNYLEVVDGQQRLTTILLLLIALRDLIEPFDQSGASYINNRYLHSEALRDNSPKLQLGRQDGEVFEILIEKQQVTQEQKKNQVYQAYEFFQKKIKGFINAGNQWTSLHDKKLAALNLVLISTETHYGAFRLFETLNNRGLELSAVDLIKNYLLGKIVDREEALNRCIDIWESIIRNLEGIDKVKFFRHYLFSVKLGVVSKNKLFEEYKSLIDAQENLVRFLEDILEKTEIYRNICFASFPKKGINKGISVINRIEASTSYTLLLKAISLGLEEKQLLGIMKSIEVFALRRSVCQTTTRDLDRIYNTLAIEAFVSSDPVKFISNYLYQRTPSDEEFMTAFKTREFNRSDQTKYILEQLEHMHTNNTNEKSINGRDEVHIEHIMPVEIASKKAKSKMGDWEKYLGDDAKQHKKYVNRIGNLTLLGSELNIIASNNPFEEKRREYAKSNILITKEISRYEYWGIGEIETRGQNLAELARRIWKHIDVGVVL